MPSRTASQILAEWHELALQRDDAADTEIDAGLAARIEQLRREYIEGVPPESTTTTAGTNVDGRIQPRR
jgi:hypothetical protein